MGNDFLRQNQNRVWTSLGISALLSGLVIAAAVTDFDIPGKFPEGFTLVIAYTAVARFVGKIQSGKYWTAAIVLYAVLIGVELAGYITRREVAMLGSLAMVFFIPFATWKSHKSSGKNSEEDI